MSLADAPRAGGSESEFNAASIRAAVCAWLGLFTGIVPLITSTMGLFMLPGRRRLPPQPGRDLGHPATVAGDHRRSGALRRGVSSTGWAMGPYRYGGRHKGA